MAALLILSGFILLIGGADALVKGSVAIANKLKIPSLIVGLTIVAFGTSVPEFVVSITSAFQGAEGIVLGNVVGSNIANILLILGCSALIYPIAVKKEDFYRDFSFLMLVTVIFIAFALMKTFVFWMGMVMLLMLVGFIVFNYKNSKAANATASEDTLSPWAEKRWMFVIPATIIGLGCIVIGADFLVDGAVMIAKACGVSEEIIGLTIIAFGTSLPELATSCVAAFRKQSDLAVGNVLGSNIWNIVFIIGATASITNIDVTPQIADYDMWVMLGATILLFPPIYFKNRIPRLVGLLYVVLYLAYLVSQILISRGIF